MTNKKLYLTKDELFGYSLWNTDEKPIYNSSFGVFKYEGKHFLPFERNFISKHFITTIFGRNFSLKDGECIEVSISLLT